MAWRGGGQSRYKPGEMSQKKDPDKQSSTDKVQAVRMMCFHVVSRHLTFAMGKFVFTDGCSGCFKCNRRKIISVTLMIQACTWCHNWLLQKSGSQCRRKHESVKTKQSILTDLPHSLLREFMPKQKKHS